MTDRIRLLLTALLVALVGGGIGVLAGCREEGKPLPPAAPAPPAPPAAAAAEANMPSSRPRPAEATHAATEALARRVVEREPSLAEVAEPALLWHRDRLAEALGGTEGRTSKGKGRCTLPEGRLLATALGPLGPEALPALVALLTSHLREGDESVARTAAETTAAHRAADVAVLHDYFVHAEAPHLRQYLMAAAAGMDPATPEVLALLAAGCRDPQPWVRNPAIARLAALGPEAAPVEATVRRLLKNPLESTRLQAAAALLQIAGPDAQAHGVFEAQLSSIDPYDRGEAVRLLATLGDAARGVWPLLLPLLGDGRLAILTLPDRAVTPDEVSWGVSEALVVLGARSLELDLLAIVRGEDARARVAAGLALVGMGIPFPEAPTVLAEALDFEPSSEWLKQVRLRRIAEKLDPKLVDDGLLDALVRHLHGLYGKEAGRALLRLGPRGRERVKTLLATKDAAREYERHSILSALQAEPALGEGLQAQLEAVAEGDSNAWNRATAGELLQAGNEGD